MGTTHHASVTAEPAVKGRSDSQPDSKHGAGQGPGGAGHQHYEGQRGQDHGEGREAAGPGEQGGPVTGRLPAVPENSHQSQEKSLAGKYENEASNSWCRVFLNSIISPDNSLQSARIKERGRRVNPRHSKCQLDTMFSM